MKDRLLIHHSFLRLYLPLRRVGQDVLRHKDMTISSTSNGFTQLAL